MTAPAPPADDAPPAKASAVSRKRERLMLALRAARGLAYVFDERFTIPGTSIRFGFDAIIGLLPVIGDSISAVASLAMVGQAFRLNLGWPLIGKMLLNIAIDWALGLVPVLDIVLDVAFKANSRNAKLMERAIADRLDRMPS
jgi:hypothetical protein